jgi:hypothetical protein
MMVAPSQATSGETDALWGIGWYPTRTGFAAYPARTDDITAAARAAAVTLSGLALAAGDIVVYCGRASESVQFAPFERATNQLGATYTCVDAARFDGRRLGAVVTLFKPSAVLGVDDQLLLGLADASVDVAAALSTVARVAARPLAREMLRAAGLDPLLWLHAGPAVAVECDHRAGAHLQARWAPETRDGSLWLATGDGTNIDTGISAAVHAGRCACGDDSPRLVLREIPDFAG